MSELSSAKKPHLSTLKYSQTEFPGYENRRHSPYYSGASYYSGDLARPLGYSSYGRGDFAVKPPGEVWTDIIPVENRYIDYEERQKIEYVPVERVARDHIEIEHRRDYIPVPRLEKHVEYVPVDRYEERVDYMPYETSYVTKGAGHAGYSGHTGTSGYYSGARDLGGYGYGYPNNYSYSSYAPSYSRGGLGYSSYGGGLGSGYYGGYYGGYGGYGGYNGGLGYSRYSRPWRHY